MFDSETPNSGRDPNLTFHCDALSCPKTAGYVVMKGYWEDQARTDEAVQQHPDEPGIAWMRTGDMAVMDEEGYVKIIGRSKDIIIRGGEWYRSELSLSAWMTPTSCLPIWGCLRENQHDMNLHTDPLNRVKCSRRKPLPSPYRKVSLSIQLSRLGIVSKDG